MRLAPVALAVLLAAPVLAAQPPARSADALAQALQERYRRVLDFSADFVQTYRGGALRTEARERGTVTIKKPGKMRWVYTDPERKEIISDGLTIYMYYPAERRVIASDVPPDGGASTGAMFLVGRGDVSRDFTASFAGDQPDGAIALKLTPRQPQSDYEHLVVRLDPATLQIRALTTLDQLGGENTLTFGNLRENRNVSDRTFEFRIPSGVTVTADGTRN
jgi:outer membrane lipoprotein carrier protein